MKPDDLDQLPDDPGKGRTIRAIVRTSGQVFLLQTLENGPKHHQDGLRSKSVQHKVVRLLEAVDLDIKIVQMEGRMWILEPKQ